MFIPHVETQKDLQSLRDMLSMMEVGTVWSGEAGEGTGLPSVLRIRVWGLLLVLGGTLLPYTRLPQGLRLYTRLLLPYKGHEGGDKVC